MIRLCFGINLLNADIVDSESDDENISLTDLHDQFIVKETDYSNHDEDFEIVLI